MQIYKYLIIILFNMSKKEKIRYLGRDEKMDSIGIPINPNPHAKQSTKSEFWTELGTIFIGADDIVGFFLSIVLAILFIIKWTFYLIGKYVFRFDIKKPIAKKKKA